MPGGSPGEALAEIRDRLAAQRRSAEVAARRKTESDALARRDSGLFRTAIDGAVPLVAPTRVLPSTARPAPLPLARSDGVLPAPAALSDGPDEPDAPTGSEDAAFARAGVATHILRRLHRGDWPAQATLDLHGMTRDQARSALVEFLGRAAVNANRCVRVVHGKGIGSLNQTPVLKSLVRRWLEQMGQVLAFVPARAEDGGTGALIVLLRQSGARPNETGTP